MATPGKATVILDALDDEQLKARHGRAERRMECLVEDLKAKKKAFKDLKVESDASTAAIQREEAEIAHLEAALAEKKVGLVAQRQQLVQTISERSAAEQDVTDALARIEERKVDLHRMAERIKERTKQQKQKQKQKPAQTLPSGATGRQTKAAGRAAANTSDLKKDLKKKGAAPASSKAATAKAAAIELAINDAGDEVPAGKRSSDRLAEQRATRAAAAKVDVPTRRTATGKAATNASRQQQQKAGPELAPKPISRQPAAPAVMNPALGAVMTGKSRFRS